MSDEQKPAQTPQQAAEADNAPLEFGEKMDATQARADFDALLKATGQKEESEKQKKTTSKAKAQPADEEESEDEESEDEVDEDDEEQEAETDDDDEESEEDEDDEEGSSTTYEKALRVLKLKHFTADDVKNLSKERVIQIANALRKDEAAITQKLEAASKTKTDSDKTAARSEDDPGKKAEAAPKGLREHATRLNQVFDDEATEAIVTTLEAIAGDYGKAFDSMKADFASKLEAANDASYRLQMENFRARLQRKKPELAEKLDDDRTWARVVKKMTSLRGDPSKKSDYDSIDALSEDALAVVFKDRDKEKQSLRAKQNGRVEAPKMRPRTRELADEEAERAIFSASLDGDLKRLERLAKKHRA